jgi:hypothetical protein
MENRIRNHPAYYSVWTNHTTSASQSTIMLEISLSKVETNEVKFRLHERRPKDMHGAQTTQHLTQWNTLSL